MFGRVHQVRGFAQQAQLLGAWRTQEQGGQFGAVYACGFGQRGFGRLLGAVLARVFAQQVEQEVGVCGDLLYEGHTAVRRAFAWRADATLTITDRFTGAEHAQELFTSRLQPEITDGTVTWRGTHAQAVLRSDPDEWSPAVERLETTNHSGCSSC